MGLLADILDPDGVDDEVGGAVVTVEDGCGVLVFVGKGVSVGVAV